MDISHVTLQNEISQLLNGDDIEQLCAKFDELDTLCKLHNAYVKDMCLVRTNCQNEIVSRLRKLRVDVEILENSDVTERDMQQLLRACSGSEQVAPGIHLRVVNVYDAQSIPDAPLYYMTSTKEFAVRVNGVLVQGRIRNMGTGTKSIACKKPACSGCKWGHSTDSEWSAGSWLHTTRALEKKNMHMRHVGGRDTLRSDIQAATRCELDTRRAQTAHDLLIQLAVDVIEPQ